jgi:predicted nucleic acid-binding protein
MRVLLDTNIVIDWLLEREPWFSQALTFWQRVDAGAIVCFLTATTITDNFYISRRLTDIERARAAVRRCLDAYEICPVDMNILEVAFALPGGDFEDNVQRACAGRIDADAIVTRDLSGFVGSTIPMLTPEQAVARFRI